MARRKRRKRPPNKPIRKRGIPGPSRENLIKRLQEVTKIRGKLKRKLSKSEIANRFEIDDITDALKSRSRSATGRKALALVELGYRDPSWKFKVGETPPGMKARMKRRFG